MQFFGYVFALNILLRHRYTTTQGKAAYLRQCEEY